MITTEETERIRNLIRIIGENVIEPMALNLEAHKLVFEMYRPVKRKTKRLFNRRT